MESKVKTEPSKSQPVKGETPSELTHRHLRDANHITTDEELRNLKLDIYSAVAPEILNEAEAAISNSDSERLLNKNDVIVSPWDAVV